MIARTTWGRALAFATSALTSGLALPVARAAPPAATGSHVVDQSLIARRLLESARTRAERVKLFQDALGTDAVRRQARALGADPDRLRAAVPHLTDRELADLAVRAARVKQDVAAGHGGGDEGLIIVGVLLLVAGIVVLAAVADDDWDDWDDWDDCDCW